MFFYKNFPFLVEEIDVKNNNIVLRYRGSNAIIKTSFVSAISNEKVVNGLSPIHACWLGGYFGRTLRDFLEYNEALKELNSIPFLLKNSHGHYKIVFRNRSGEIGYINKKTNKEFVEHPLTVANNNYIISGFDSSQACYIGILAGISMERTISQDAKTGQNQLDKLLKKPPKLRLVR